MQLQVVPHRLDSAVGGPGRLVHRIDAADVQGYRDDEVALGNYFADAVKRAAKKSKVLEPAIRRFEEQLITAKGFVQTFERPPSDGGDTTCSRLESSYPIRHDDRQMIAVRALPRRLVDLIRKDNRRWFRAELGPWVEPARLCRREGPVTCSSMARLQEASRWLEDHGWDAGDLVREFVEESRRAANAERLLARPCP